MKKEIKILNLIFISIFLSSKAQEVELIKSFVGNSQKSEIITFTPQDEILLSGDFSGYLNYWDIPNKALINSIKAHLGRINRIEFSENGEYFLTFSSNDRKVKIWNFSSQDTVINFDIQNTPVFAIFYDQNSVLIGDKNGEIYHKDFFYPEKDSIFYKNPLSVYDANLNENKNKLVITDENSIKIINLDNDKK